MDARVATAESQHSYHSIYHQSNTARSPATTTTTAVVKKTSRTSLTSPPASTAVRPGLRGKAHSYAVDGSLDVASSSLPNSLSASNSTESLSTSTPNSSAVFNSSAYDLAPFWLPQQSNVYYAQLLYYNKLISPSRGGGLTGPPLPPLVSSSSAQAGSRSRSSSKVSLKDGTPAKGKRDSGGHGNRSQLNNTDKTRSAMTSSEVKLTSKMAASTSAPQAEEPVKGQPIKSVPASSASKNVAHSSSVPSTPHQHPRHFSSESREPSPNDANHNHSPRSVYSETNGNLPSLRPLGPPRLGGNCRYETAQANSRRRMPYNGGSDRLEKANLGKLKGKLTEEEEKKVASDMREVYDRLLPTEAVEEKRKLLVQKLEKIFNDEWPGHDIEVHLFGSSGNLLCSDDSDVDICISTKWRDMENVCMIAELLAQRGMEKVVCISGAKVPIVKIWDPELALACDMNVNNTDALENTRLIRTYVDTDPRVRQLAMIIKYWSRRRIINDAALGGTLSSYTWICLIIAFLQLRTPSVLPALHQLPFKMMRTDNAHSTFADNMKKLRGLGSKNKSTEADLLFQFFRFYAHEFDYDKYILSIRLGKLIPRADKGWVQGIAGVCVEEPFNTSRNLGNTADEYSFRGLHLELRRAFDLIAEAKFEEVCEQYVFPKEEERVWSKPAAPRRPVLLRSASQTHPNRGGRGGQRGGGRHGNRGNGNGSNRRPSSSVPVYDPTGYVPPINLQQPQELWSMAANAQYPYAYTNDMMTMAYHENIRQMQLYAQSPAYTQAMQQPMMASTSNPGQASSDRSRTNSVETAPPLSAPLRQDLWQAYGMGLAQPFYFQHVPHSNNYGTYPSSPTASSMSGGQDFRRPSQRSGAERGPAAPSSSLRSQSQPAARSPGVAHPPVTAQYPFPVTTSMTSVPMHLNGAYAQNFVSDDADTDFDETPKAKPMTPRPQEEEQDTHSITDSQGPQKAPQRPQVITNGIAVGEANGKPAGTSPVRRRLSTEQLPQAILDRRMKRTSRSPSPLGRTQHNFASIDSTSANNVNKASTRPLVVNGSGLRTSVSATSRQSPVSESVVSDHSGMSMFDNPLNISQGYPMSRYTSQSSAPPDFTNDDSLAPLTDRPPVIVNGSNPSPAAPSLSEDASFRERISAMQPVYMNPATLAHAQTMQWTNMGHYQPAISTQHPRQSAAIAPLDLASDSRLSRTNGVDASLLSPVYENMTPSPHAARKMDHPGKVAKSGSKLGEGKPVARNPNTSSAALNDDDWREHPQASRQPKTQKAPTPAVKTNGRESGHVRAAKSESDGGWQKAGKGKKKAAAGAVPGHAEPFPKNTSERKGG